MMPMTSESLNAALALDLIGSYEQFVVEYQDRIFRFALRYSGNRQDAEEIAQDAFVRAFNALKSYERSRIEELNLKPWIYTIALNVARNRVRSKKEPVVSMDKEAPDGGRLIDPPAPANRFDPYHLAEMRELSNRLAKAITELPPRYRSPVILRHIEGLSFAEIAATLGQPAGTAKANVHRGVRLLRKQLLQDKAAQNDSVFRSYATASPVAVRG
jgi:RNA polymerase sigma-70 factor, ECF subfamily